MRELLRDGTRTAHERLDAKVSGLDLSDRADYARFLRFHAVARAGVEQWLAENAPRGMAPPAQTPLIREDLTALGERAPASAPAFGDVPPTGWLGVAYVVAGSHLGNRVLAERIAAEPAARASRFLRGEAMSAYWKDLRSLLGETASKADATNVLAGARATFGHFSQVAATTGAVLPA